MQNKLQKLGDTQILRLHQNEEPARLTLAILGEKYLIEDIES